jgi:2-dehydropantoate 2-reductase
VTGHDTKGHHTMKKIVVVGPGAVGGYLAGLLAKAGQDVAVLGREGAHLQAIRESGLQLSIADHAPEQIKLHATSHAEELGEADLVILTVKGQDVPAAAQAMQPLLGDETHVLMIGNGIPWWYGYGLGGAHESRKIDAVDPEGHLYHLIEPRRVLGGVTNVGASIPKPGHVHMKTEQWFRIGEPSGAMTPRLQAVCNLLCHAGVEAQPREDIRSDIWHKLWGNAFYNPVSVLTGATIQELTDDEIIRTLIVEVMWEVRRVAEAFGVDSLRGIDKRLEIARRLGHHKTSMLQDWEAGKTLEIGPIIGAIVEMADWEAIDVPKVSMLYRLLEKKQQCRNTHATTFSA